MLKLEELFDKQMALQQQGYKAICLTELFGHLQY
jgi:hypothetical protein